MKKYVLLRGGLLFIFLNLSGCVTEPPKNPTKPNGTTQIKQQQPIPPITNGENNEEKPMPPGNGQPPIKLRKRVALVIGNGAYQNSPLPNPVNDAYDMTDKLKGLGFEVMRATDAGQNTMEKVIKAFGNKLHNNMVGLFYYSGHGVQFEGKNYMIPIGGMSTITVREDITNNAVSVNDVKDIMDKNNADNGLNLIVLDACRDNPFSFSKSMKGGLVAMDSAEGMLIAYATAPGNVAQSSPSERNSPYTKHLLHFIGQNTPIELMLKYVRKAVKHETNGAQKPWYKASMDGMFKF